MVKDIFEQSSDYVAFIFLNDECPICIYYTKKLNELDDLCLSKGITLVGIFSGTYKRKNITEFKNLFSLKSPLYIDKKFKLAEMLFATVTPEIFLISKSENRILYRGMIDDNFAELGVRKKVVSQEYFTEALFEVLNGETVKISKSEPIGCPINY
ncbi:MAG: hypothetical protein IPM42_04785 [Saprospiraceae bacterium]|nr:hypothetical protein [Saprospiraceae bacterium]